VAFPKAREIRRDLHGALIGSEQVQRDRDASSEEVRPARGAEEVLKS
jgi:hypothetical protein